MPYAESVFEGDTERGLPYARSMKNTSCQPPTIPLTTPPLFFRKLLPLPNGKAYVALTLKSAGKVVELGETMLFRSHGPWRVPPMLVRFFDHVKLPIIVRPFE